MATAENDYTAKLENEKEVADHMSKAMSSMGGYLCLSFVAAQFIAYFNYTNLGTVIAVRMYLLLSFLRMNLALLLMLLILLIII